MKRRSQTRLLAATLFLSGAALVIWAIYAFMHPIVIIRWSTATEFQTAGYAIYRSKNPTGPFEQISEELIPAASDPLTGGTYEFTDREVLPGETYYYLLEEIEMTGATNRDGPVESTALRRGLAEGILGAMLLAGAFTAIRLEILERRADDR